MPISALPVPVRRAGYRVAHAGLRVYWRVARPQTRGVKCVVRDGDDVVFVRHSYGDRRLWELPGGGIKRGHILGATDELGAEAVECVPDVDEAGVERCDAEPDRVRSAEVGDDVRALDQRAADRPRLRVGDRDVGAAPHRVAR